MSGLPDLHLPNLHKPGRRPQDGDWPTAIIDGAVDYTPDEELFIRAVAQFRTVNKIATPTLCQLLWVARQLGYRRSGSSACCGSCR